MFHERGISRLITEYIVVHFIKTGGNMNICFLFGKINSDISFNFLPNQNQHISVASCFLLSQNEIEVLLYAFDELADKLYSNYEKGFFIRLEGNITNDYVEVNRIYEY